MQGKLKDSVAWWMVWEQSLFLLDVPCTRSFVWYIAGVGQTLFNFGGLDRRVFH